MIMIGYRVRVGLALLFALSSGCIAYVNIPAQPGDFARHNPNDRAVRIVLTEAINAVNKKFPVEGKFAILLPQDTTTKTYHAVSKKSGKQAVWPGNTDRTDLPVLTIKQIRIRRQDAWVDIVRSTHNDGKQTDQLMTVEMKWHPLQGWLIQRLRVWGVKAEDALWKSEQEDE